MGVKVYLSVSIYLAITGPLYLPASASECYPDPPASTDHYLIGYGSLVNAQSKNRTYPNTGINIPVLISGFKRTWTARGETETSLSCTYLGVDKSPGSNLNGVIFSVPNSVAVQNYDAREKFYCRVRVPYTDIAVLKGSISDNGTFPAEAQLQNSEFWIYVTKPECNKIPDKMYPIFQSYVDIFLSGCIQMEEKYGLADYANDCMTKTEGWEHPWVNDRIYPRRPFSFEPNAWSVDKLISRNVEFKGSLHTETDDNDIIDIDKEDDSSGSPLGSSCSRIMVYVLMSLLIFMSYCSDM